MGLFEDFVEENYGYDFVEVLEIYEDLFDRLSINTSKHPELLRTYSSEELQCNLKLMLLYQAQEDGIIPEELDIESWFDVDDTFAISVPEELTLEQEERINKIVSDFKEWSGIQLDIE